MKERRLGENAIQESSTATPVSRAPELVSRVDHIAIAVRDLDAAIQWYTQGLGMQVMEQRTTHGARTSMISAVLRLGSAVIVLVQGREAESQVSRFVDQFGPGVQHMAFLVSDLDAALERLFAAGGAIDTPIIEEAGIRQAFLRREGGSGVRVELIERKGGDFTDRSVERLFRAFEERELY